MKKMQHTRTMIPTVQKVNRKYCHGTNSVTILLILPYLLYTL